jgi:hypothetical protein
MDLLLQVTLEKLYSVLSLKVSEEVKEHVDEDGCKKLKRL